MTDLFTPINIVLSTQRWNVIDLLKMAATGASGQTSNSVSNIFENLTYGPAPEADNVAKVMSLICCT